MKLINAGNGPDFFAASCCIILICKFLIDCKCSIPLWPSGTKMLHDFGLAEIFSLETRVVCILHFFCYLDNTLSREYPTIDQWLLWFMIAGFLALLGLRTGNLRKVIHMHPTFPAFVDPPCYEITQVYIRKSSIIIISVVWILPNFPVGCYHPGWIQPNSEKFISQCYIVTWDTLCTCFWLRV